MAITPFKACASLEALGERPLVLIAGGALETFWTTGLHASREEGRLLDRAATLATERAREIVLFGGAAPILAARLADAGHPRSSLRTVETLAEAAREAATLARPGDDVLLAPVFYVGPELGDVFGPALLEALREARPPGSMRQ
jgi:UDP-N-acetylmuramoylalanine-D-glutamate ligase